MPPKPPSSLKQAWRDRLTALKDLPQFWRLLRDAAPTTVRATISLRMLGGLAPLGMLYAAKQIIDLISTKGSQPDLPSLWFWIGVEFALAAISQLIGRVVDFCDAFIADRFSHSLGLKIMRHAATLDLSSFEDSAFHDRLERARAQSTDRIGMLTSSGWLLQRLVMLISLAAGIIFYSPWLFAVLIISVVPTFLVESHFAFLGYTQATAQTTLRRTLDYYLTLGTSREAAKEVKVFALAPHLETKYSKLAGTLMLENRRLAARRLRWGGAFTVLATAGYYGSYVYLARDVALNHMSLGTFTFVAGTLAGANGHLQTIFSLFSDIADQALFLRDLALFFEDTPTIRASTASLLPPRPIRSGIIFENVSFHYPGQEKLVLNQLNLHFSQGERVAIVGKNGEGKTTIVKLIARLYDPIAGRILLDGKDLRDFHVDELRSEIGIIFQDFIRYDLSVRENIAVGSIGRLRDDEALWEATRKSNAQELIEKFPQQLDQMLGGRFEGGSDLSGGEWQRLALARAYLRDAQILILDEPTAALDPLAEAEVFQKFAELTHEKLAIFISHRFSTVRMADRIVLLAQGQIAEDGTHDQLIQAGGPYSCLFEVQAASYR
ncbi:MAG: ABC transporter ATP-binding protein/permease [Bryobacteraceae bacterium]|nr:ABC transporter ATP-binding protein/permease [Bryobacteraceae bacterium]